MKNENIILTGKELNKRFREPSYIQEEKINNTPLNLKEEVKALGMVLHDSFYRVAKNCKNLGRVIRIVLSLPNEYMHYRRHLKKIKSGEFPYYFMPNLNRSKFPEGGYGYDGGLLLRIMLQEEIEYAEEIGKGNFFTFVQSRGRESLKYHPKKIIREWREEIAGLSGLLERIFYAVPSAVIYLPGVAAYSLIYPFRCIMEYKKEKKNSRRTLECFGMYENPKKRSKKKSF